MEVKQIYELTNTVVNEVLGDTVVVEEDLSNLVDVGTAIFNAGAFDPIMKSLINHIGKVDFVIRSYSGAAPSVLMDSWEFGSIREKIASEMPEAVENESWSPEDGRSYDPNIFIAPKAQAKFYNKRTTFEIDRSITEKQFKQSFSSTSQLNAFFMMLENEVQKALTVRTDALVMRTINNMTAETLLNQFPGGSGLTNAGGVKAINLLKRYNDAHATSLTAKQAITNPEFLRYATLQFGLYSDRLTSMSTMFNAGGMQRFTPKNLQHTIMLSEFSAGADVYLQSGTFHDNYTSLVQHETVPFWQGTGSAYDFDDTSKIIVNAASGSGTITAGGIICVMFDRDALGVTNFERRVTTQWNPKAEFTNYFYKQDMGYFNDLNENYVVFYLA